MPSTRIHLDLSATDLGVLLGRTEARIMELAWSQNQLTVKRALTLMDESPRPAYTTIMTIMNRLCQKRLLTRSRQGRHFVYSSAVTRESFLATRIKEIVDCLKVNFPEAFEGAVR